MDPPPNYLIGRLEKQLADLRVELANLKATRDGLLKALGECHQVLGLASSDIYQTARVNQANLTGVDLPNLYDRPCKSRIGTFFVSQRGVDESLQLVNQIRCVLAQQDDILGIKALNHEGHEGHEEKEKKP